MKKHSLQAVLWVILALPLVCAAPALHAQQPAKAEAKHCLWKVEGKTNAVHLLGSIHFLKKEFYPLPKPIEDAYARSQVVVFEADLDELSSPESQVKMLQHAAYPPGETLKQNVSKETHDKLQSYLSEAGVPAITVESLKPWMAAVLLLGLELQKLGFDPEQGVDQYFFKKAKQDKKQIVGLETVDLQISFFTGFTKEEQDAVLKETLQEISGFKAMLTDVVNAWKTGDTKKLDALVLDAIRDYPQLQKKLLVDRNKAWLGKIEKLLAEGKSVFVVVGAAHLIGKDSVVDLLEKKGLKVRQM
ncbi:MAG: TraB/GumN family protein [Verrucomicrobia subdivision 3 bacterium]|nr:TraB/GumN family protein [Limisphaerales bacterium]